MHNKRLRNSSLSFGGHDEYTNKTFSHLLSTSVENVRAECTNYAIVDSNFVITEIKNEPNSECTESVFDVVKVKEEPTEEFYCGGTDEADSFDNFTDEYLIHFPTNTVTKEEVIIEPDAEVSELTKSNESITTAESHKNDEFTKRRKKVYKNWQQHTVFQRESEAVEVIRRERIWTKYTTNRNERWIKVIYRCRNVKSRGQQCEAGVYLLYSHFDSSVTLYRSVNRHTCDSIQSERKRPIKLNATAATKIEVNDNRLKTDEAALKRRRKIVKNWQKERPFELEDDALAAVKDEQTWAKYTTNKTDKGRKVIYRCKNAKSRGPQCEAGVYLLYSPHDPIVTLYRSVNSHTCDTIDSTRKPYVRRKSRAKTESEKVIEKYENQNELRRRKKVVKNWQKVESFGLEMQALGAVTMEQTWTKYTTNKTSTGKKVIYRCRNVKSKGQQCDAGVYLLYAFDGTVTMYRSANQHTCDKIESKSKSTLSDAAKFLIRSEYEKGSKPKYILGLVTANGFNCKQIQINNYLAQLRRDASQAEVADFEGLW